LLALLVALLVPSATAAAASLDRWNGHIAEASARFGVPAEWIRRVIAAESGGRTHENGQPITSRAGAMGLMQLMPGTWAEMRVRHRLGVDPHDPRDNILAGTAYLRAMYDRFGYPGLFAAYNAGPARYAQHLSIGSRLPAETIAYVADVEGGGARSQPTHPPPAQASPLFAVLSVAEPIAADRQPQAVDPVHDSLFVRLSGAAPR
jgi:soluble lytic murein transglycosylase-like protein